MPVPLVERKNNVLNLTTENFGGYLKMGDLIAVLNILTFIRKSSNTLVKFYLPNTELQNKEHVLKFKKFLDINTDFFSEVPGNRNYEMIWEIWSFRATNGEHIIIDNKLSQQKKICIFPLLTAVYNTERNWPNYILQNIIIKFSKEEYDSFEKILCIEDSAIINSIDTMKFSISTDFETNLMHAMTCSHYVGGDTGFSHFTSVLSDNKKLLYYYNKTFHGAWESYFTRPFYLREKGKLQYYETDASIT